MSQTQRHSPYTGILAKAKMPVFERRAYYIWMEQRNRCQNPKHPFYAHYGAKGIRVEYSSREFIGWWVAEMKTFKGQKPDVSRIDHSKNYSFDNIFLDEHRSNVQERNTRLGNPSPRKQVFAYDRTTLKLLGTFEHTRQAAKAMGTNQRSVVLCCTGKAKGTKSGLTFSYENRSL